MANREWRNSKSTNIHISHFQFFSFSFTLSNYQIGTSAN